MKHVVAAAIIGAIFGLCVPVLVYAAAALL